MYINRQKRVRVKLRALDAFAEKAAALLRVPRDAVTICLVSNAQIASWNRAYRGKSKATDVLSFSALTNGHNHRGESPRIRSFAREAREYLGDIAIAPAIARRNARALGRSFDAEMKILTLHGLLHLMGYDHETDNGAMERVESRLRRKLGLA